MIGETVRSLEKKNLVVSVLLIVLGALLTWQPIGFIKTIVVIIGATLFVLSVLDFIAYFNSNQEINNVNLFKGIIELIASILLVFRNDVLIDLFPTILGIIIIFNNIFKIEIALSIKKVDDTRWLYGFISALLCVILGVFIILNPFKALEIVIRFAGILLLVTEIAGLVYSLIIIRACKDLVKTVDVEVTDHVEDEKAIEAEIEEPKKVVKKAKTTKKKTKKEK